MRRRPGTLPPCSSLAGSPAFPPPAWASASRVRRSNPGVTDLPAEFVHFVDEARRRWTTARDADLARLLHYGPRAESPRALAGRHLLGRAAPRHDLAVVVEGHRHRAQLRPRRRPAHRARHRVLPATGRALSADAARRCGALLHDRMTEAVLRRLARRRAAVPATRAPQPLAHVDVLGAAGARRWSEANRELGLALSATRSTTSSRTSRASGATPPTSS